MERQKIKQLIFSSKQINLPRISRNNKLKRKLLNLKMMNSTQKLKLLEAQLVIKKVVAKDIQTQTEVEPTFYHAAVHGHLV